MNRGKKKLGRRKNIAFKSSIKKKSGKDRENVNKKAIFNRYKNKQKVEEELAKKMLIERKFHQEQVNYSESEEEDVYSQLVSSFKRPVNKNVESEDDSISEESTQNITSEFESHDGNQDVHSDNENGHTNMEREEVGSIYLTDNSLKWSKFK